MVAARSKAFEDPTISQAIFDPACTINRRLTFTSQTMPRLPFELPPSSPKAEQPSAQLVPPRQEPSGRAGVFATVGMSVGCTMSKSVSAVGSGPTSGFEALDRAACKLVGTYGGDAAIIAYTKAVYCEAEDRMSEARKWRGVLGRVAAIDRALIVSRSAPIALQH